MTMSARALLFSAFGLFAVGGSVLAQTTAAPKTLVDVGGHKLNVRVSGTANPGVPTVVFESGRPSAIVLGARIPRPRSRNRARSVSYWTASVDFPSTAETWTAQTLCSSLERGLRVAISAP